MTFWMARTAYALSGELRSRVDAAGSAWTLALVGALAVSREGLETALFVLAATHAAASSSTSATDPLLVP
jgi:high-affinity iron transporter